MQLSSMRFIPIPNDDIFPKYLNKGDDWNIFLLISLSKMLKDE
jgi:hypothetical protein